MELKDDHAVTKAYKPSIRSICIIYVDAVSGIMKRCAEFDDQNRRTCSLPPVLLGSIILYSKQQFSDLTVSQNFFCCLLIQSRKSFNCKKNSVILSGKHNFKRGFEL